MGQFSPQLKREEHPVFLQSRKHSAAIFTIFNILFHIVRLQHQCSSQRHKLQFKLRSKLKVIGWVKQPQKTKTTEKKERMLLILGWVRYLWYCLRCKVSAQISFAQRRFSITAIFHNFPSLYFQGKYSHLSPPTPSPQSILVDVEWKIKTFQIFDQF